ncbi:hypothetical protein SIN09_38590, partial [Streptomyces sp. F8]|nr:hypothetical protein [Streptomyces sp. F8]
DCEDPGYDDEPWPADPWPDPGPADGPDDDLPHPAQPPGARAGMPAGAIPTPGGLPAAADDSTGPGARVDDGDTDDLWGDQAAGGPGGGAVRAADPSHRPVPQ